MPVAVAEQLVAWGHEVELLEPQTTITCLSALAKETYDAYVLKTVSDGPGLSLVEAAEAAGLPAGRERAASVAACAIAGSPSAPGGNQ